MYVFCSHSSVFFSPSSHAVLPQSILSPINPGSSMAPINRTLLTSYTWPARCLKLPLRRLPFLSSVPLILFHLSFCFQHSVFCVLFFSLSILLYIWLLASYFCLWIRLVRQSIRRTVTPVLWKDSLSCIYSLILQGQLQLSIVLQHVWTQCVSRWLLGHEHD